MKGVAAWIVFVAAALGLVAQPSDPPREPAQATAPAPTSSPAPLPIPALEPVDPTPVPMRRTARPIDDVEIPLDYRRWAKRYSRLFMPPGFDSRWVLCQMRAESNFVSAAVSPVGAAGLMQIMPETWRELQKKMRWVNNIWNPEQNIAAGVKYLAAQRAAWKARRPEKDRLALAFAAYNAGLGNPLKAQRICISEDAGNCNRWRPIARFAPRVRTWKHVETLTYVNRIFDYMGEKI